MKRGEYFTVCGVFVILALTVITVWVAVITRYVGWPNSLMDIIEWLT